MSRHAGRRPMPAMVVGARSRGLPFGSHLCCLLRRHGVGYGGQTGRITSRSLTFHNGMPDNVAGCFRRRPDLVESQSLTVDPNLALADACKLVELSADGWPPTIDPIKLLTHALMDVRDVAAE